MVDIVMWNWIIVVSLTVTIAVCLLGEYKNVQHMFVLGWFLGTGTTIGLYLLAKREVKNDQETF